MSSWASLPVRAERVSAAAEEEDLERREMNLKQFIIDRNSFFLGKNIKESGIRDEYKCLVVGVEKEDSTLMTLISMYLLRKEMWYGW